MKKLLILSGKGGTGKTTTAAAFIRFAQARAVADCDVDAPNLHIVTKLEGQGEREVFMGADKAHIDPERCIGCGACVEHCRFGAIQMENGTCQVVDHACEGCAVCTYVCPADAVSMKPSPTGELELYKKSKVFSTAQLKMGCGNSGMLVTKVKQNMLQNAPDTDLAVIDGSPGIGCPVIASVTGVDLVLIVAEPSLSGLNDLKRIVDTADILRVHVAVCVNKFDTSPENTKEIQNFCAQRELPFVGMIPYDKAASEAINQGCSVADLDCPASRALRQVYSQVRELLSI